MTPRRSRSPARSCCGCCAGAGPGEHAGRAPPLGGRGMPGRPRPHPHPRGPATVLALPAASLPRVNGTRRRRGKPRARPSRTCSSRWPAGATDPGRLPLNRMAGITWQNRRRGGPAPRRRAPRPARPASQVPAQRPPEQSRSTQTRAANRRARRRSQAGPPGGEMSVPRAGGACPPAPGPPTAVRLRLPLHPGKGHAAATAAGGGGDSLAQRSAAARAPAPQLTLAQRILSPASAVLVLAPRQAQYRHTLRLPIQACTP